MCPYGPNVSQCVPTAPSGRRGLRAPPGSALLRCDSALRGSPPAFLPPRLRWTRVGAAEEAPPLLLLAVGRGGGALGLGKGGALVLPRLRLSQSGPYVCQMGGAVSTTLVNVEGSSECWEMG